MANTAKEQIYLLLTNTVFLSAVCSWLSAQFIKAAIKLISGKVSSLKELIELMLWRTGGMPSSHSAVVISLTTSIGFHSGVGSDIFILAACFAFVVIRDAVGVRRSSGIQAKVLNEVGVSLDKKSIINFRPIKEVQGHKPLEVFVGCILGCSIAVAFSTL